MMRVLTEIYPADVKPMRDGWYLTRYLPHMSWTLNEFRAGAWRFLNGDLCNVQGREWLGLAFDPAVARECVDFVYTPGRDLISERGVFVPGGECC